VFESLPALAPQVSAESVVAANPEAILTTSDEAEAGPAWRRDPQAPDFATWRPLRRMTAVRRGWMFTVRGELLTRQGPRIVQGARAVCEALDRVRAERGAGSARDAGGN
jgi:iron complex transport system substrate-binding protein